MIYGSYDDGNFHRLVSFLKKLLYFVPVVGKGENLIQPVFFEDLSDAYFKIIINKRKTFNKEYILAGKAPIKYIDAIQEILLLLKKKYFFIKIPFFMIIFFVNFLSIFVGKNSFYWMLLRMKENKIFSINEAKNDFNYNPRNFYDGIKLAFNNYFKKN
jgi:nucleoside-diphosphate-sugar epimerase